MLSVADLSLSYGASSVLGGVSFDLAPGEILCLLGASGCGKTTLLKAIAGLHRPAVGRITLGETFLSSASVAVRPEKRGIGLVFQDGALFPHLTAVENVAYGLPKNSPRTAQDWLSLVGLEGMAGRYPCALSGGQRQRLALVRALAAQPKLLLLDEPFASLDAGLRLRLREEVRAILKESGVPAILVTHDPEEAMLFGDRILLLEAGRTAQLGTAEELYYQPASPSVVRFFSEAHELQAQVENRLAKTPFGQLRADFSSPLARVLIRPEAFQLTEAANALHGTVLSSRFLGNRRLLQVQTPGHSTPVGVLTPPSHHFPAGAQVGIALDERHAFAFPA